MNSSLKLVAHTHMWDGPACYIQSLIRRMDQSIEMSSLGWTGSILSNQLGSANPRQVSLTNCGWLPAGATGGPVSSKTSSSNEVSLENQAQISAEVSELLSKGAIAETRVLTDQFFLNFFW